MKKLVSLLSLMLTVVLALTSMGAALAESAQPEVSFLFGFWGDAKESQMKMDLANLYMQEHPNVKIEFTYTDGPSYLTKMQTWFSSNTVPDVFGFASDHLWTYNDPRFYEDLTPFIERDGLSSAFSQASIDAYKVGDSIVSLPFIAKTFAVAYNKDLFDAAQLGYPSADWTEEDMLAMAQALTKDTDNGKQYGMRWGVRPPEFYRNLYGNPVYSLEDKTMNAAGNKEFEAALNLFSGYIRDGLSPDETAAQIASGGFETGMFGMQLIATWDIAAFQDMIGDKFSWDVVELPLSTQFNTRMKTTYRGNAWSISQNAANKDACWDFIKWMSTDEKALEIAQSIGVPEMTSYSESDAYMTNFGQGTAYDKGVFIRMIDDSVPFCHAGIYGQVNDMMKVEYDLVVAGQQTVEQAVEKIQAQGAQIFGTNG